MTPELTNEVVTSIVWTNLPARSRTHAFLRDSAFRRAFAAELPIPDGVTFTRDIEFSNPDNQHLQVNLAQPKGDGPFPAIVCIHGGGFRILSKDTHWVMALALARLTSALRRWRGARNRMRATRRGSPSKRTLC